MKFEDVTRFGSLEEAKENLFKLQKELKLCASKVPFGVNNDYTGHALQNLVNFSSTLLERLVKYLEEPIEMSAWIARNLFECYLISVYITSDPERAKEFLVQKASDELEIYEGILTLNKLANTKTNETPIRERMEHIKKTMKKHNLIEASHWTVGMLAKQTGNKDEYDAFFKLYSKYVHPSSWLINAQLNESDNSVFRNVFLLQSQLYAASLLKVASNYKIKTS
jgi:hypothetical protein